MWEQSYTELANLRHDDRHVSGKTVHELVAKFRETVQNIKRQGENSVLSEPVEVAGLVKLQWTVPWVQDN